jgi:hypothetical protein
MLTLYFMGYVYKTWGGVTASISKSPAQNKSVPKTWGGVTVSTSNNQESNIKKQIEEENKIIETINKNSIPQTKQNPVTAQTLKPADKQYMSWKDLKGKQITGEGVRDSPNTIKVDKTGAVYIFRDNNIERTMTYLPQQKTDTRRKAADIIYKDINLKETFFPSTKGLKDREVNLQTYTEAKLTQGGNWLGERLTRNMKEGRVKNILTTRVPYRYTDTAKFAFFAPAMSNNIYRDVKNAAAIKDQDKLITFTVKQTKDSYKGVQQVTQGNNKYTSLIEGTSKQVSKKDFNFFGKSLTKINNNVLISKTGGTSTNTGIAPIVAQNNKGAVAIANPNFKGFIVKGFSKNTRMIYDTSKGINILTPSKTYTNLPANINKQNVFGIVTKTGTNKYTVIAQTGKGNQFLNNPNIFGTIKTTGSRGTASGTKTGINILFQDKTLFQKMLTSSVITPNLKTTSVAGNLGNTISRDLTRTTTSGLTSSLLKSDSKNQYNIMRKSSTTILKQDDKTPTTTLTTTGTKTDTATQTNVKTGLWLVNPVITKPKQTGRTATTVIQIPTITQPTPTSNKNINSYYTFGGNKLGFNRDITGTTKTGGLIFPPLLSPTKDILTVKNIKSSRNYAYTPSFIALLTGKKGKQPTKQTYTGFEVRPITKGFNWNKLKFINIKKKKKTGGFF